MPAPRACTGSFAVCQPRKTATFWNAPVSRLGKRKPEFLRWALHLAKPNVVIETGTNKGFFGYLLSLLLQNVTLHTFDIKATAARPSLLNEGQKNVSCISTKGIPGLHYVNCR